MPNVYRILAFHYISGHVCSTRQEVVGFSGFRQLGRGGRKFVKFGKEQSARNFEMEEKSSCIQW